MQNDGYTVAEARERLGAQFRAKWVHFCWGTDIEFFGRHPDHAPAHLPRIRKVLALCDFLIADTKRDLRAAREMGFMGELLGDLIAPGGFNLGEIARLRRESGEFRDTILVKGREGGLVGRALNVFAALDRVGSGLAPYRIRVVMPTPPAVEAARALATRHHLDCEPIPRLPYQELLKEFGKSRIAISASEVDGTPSFLLEAMAMGALPIHSDMESVRDWIEHGRNGLLFPVDDIDALANCITRALQDEALTVSARALNWSIAEGRMDRDAIRAHIQDLLKRRVLAPVSIGGTGASTPAPRHL
jgi:glycosyltransferase involved in cell wall biosynthesis